MKEFKHDTAQISEDDLNDISDEIVRKFLYVLEKEMQRQVPEENYVSMIGVILVKFICSMIVNVNKSTDCGSEFFLDVLVDNIKRNLNGFK